MLGSMVVSARAEDVVAYQAEGDAPAGGADARVMALDSAFSNAVTNALAEIVAPDVRGARKGELDREIVARARLWVAKFTVTRDETSDGRRQLSVSVKVDRDKIRARLNELGIAMKGAAPTPQPPDTAPPPSRTATILLRLTSPKGVRADYGPSADAALSGLSTLTAVLRGAGYAVRKAPASGAAPRGEGELPLSDDEALALGGEAQAESMLVAGVTIGQMLPVRGLAVNAALVTARVRMIDRNKKVIGQGSGIAAARGEDAGYAIDRALRAAATDVFPPAPAKLAQATSFRGEDAPLVEPGIVLVRLPARTPYTLVLAEQKYLAGAKGVRSATLRRLSPSGWVIGVATGESIDQIARIAKKSPSSDSTATVKVMGDIVELSLGGAP